MKPSPWPASACASRSSRSRVDYPVGSGGVQVAEHHQSLGGVLARHGRPTPDVWSRVPACYRLGRSPGGRRTRSGRPAGWPLRHAAPGPTQPGVHAVVPPGSATDSTAPPWTRRSGAGSRPELRPRHPQVAIGTSCRPMRSGPVPTSASTVAAGSWLPALRFWLATRNRAGPPSAAGSQAAPNRTAQASAGSSTARARGGTGAAARQAASRGRRDRGTGCHCRPGCPDRGCWGSAGGRR